MAVASQARSLAGRVGAVVCESGQPAGAFAEGAEGEERHNGSHCGAGQAAGKVNLHVTGSNTIGSGVFPAGLPLAFSAGTATFTYTASV